VAGSDRSGEGNRWQVFISHTSELRDFPVEGNSYVDEVERAISAARHVIVDMADIPATDRPPAQVCVEQVRGCDVYVGVLGTRYGSPVRDKPEVSYTELEFDAAAAAGLPRLVFVLDTTAADVGIPLDQLIDHQFGPRQEAFRRRVQGSGLTTQSFRNPAELGRLVERSLRELADARQGSGPLPPGSVLRLWNIPARNLAFTGRGGLLAAVRDRLLAGDKTVVQAFEGMGGVGKTQLAVEYAHRFADGYDLAWWVDSEQAGLIGDQFAALGLALGCVQPGAGIEAVRAAVLAELHGRDRWLLVFDNAQTPADIAPWLPGGAGHVLITSRERSWTELAAPVEVDVLARTESVAILQGRVAGLGDADADRLAAQLGDLPLAVAQAAGFMAETSMAAAQYLELLGTQPGQLLDQAAAGSSYPRSLAAATQLIAARLDAEDPAAAQLAGLCAFLAPEPIPEDLFTSAVGDLPGELAARAPDPLGWRQTLGHLARQSLARIDQRGLVMHRLAQAILRDRFGEQERRVWAQRAVELLRRAFPAAAEEPSAWPRCSQLLAHVLAATENARAKGVASETSASLLTHAGVYLRARAELDLAQTVLEQAVEIREAVLGARHPGVAVTLTHLGTVLRRRGEPARAGQVLERALEIREGALRRDHPDVAETLTHLGIALRDVGDLSRGQAVLERALAIMEAALGANHPGVAVTDVAFTLTYLGTVLRRSGDPDPARARQVLERARQVLERAREINTAAYGLQDWRLAVTLAHLGHVYRELGDLTEARDAHERALAIRQSVYPGQHPEVAFAFRDLGRTLQAAGDVAGARSHMERALGILEAAYGPTHPETATSLDRLAIILHDQGDLDGARSRHERALTIREAGLGPDHPDTARSREQLAAVVRELAKRE
jgi:tetratricopeptide (TPR) repeat protein